MQLRIPFAHSYVEGPRNLLSVGNYPVAVPIEANDVKRVPLPLHFEPGIDRSVYRFLFRLPWFLTSTASARLHLCAIMMHSMRGATMVHYLRTWLEPEGHHLIVEKALLRQEALLGICITRYVKRATLYLDVPRLWKKLFQALTDMVLDEGWRK